MGDSFQSKLMEINGNFQSQLTENGKKLDICMSSLEVKIGALMKMFVKETQGNGGAPIQTDHTPLLPTPDASMKLMKEVGQILTNRDRMGKNIKLLYPKIELPYFGGDNPREWLRKCNKFFGVHQVDESAKMDLIEMYLEGKAASWFQGLKMANGKVSWSEFSEYLLKRFDERLGKGDVEEFNKLHQTNSEKFECLKLLLLSKNLRLSEQYFVSSYISGLKEELKPMVRMLKPQKIGKPNEEDDEID